MSQLVWTFQKFDELTPAILYSILNLRSRVFVVEQNCAYLDTDGRDSSSYHLCGWLQKELVAYCRILPKGIAYEHYASIGRVVTHPAHRKNGYGKILIQKAIEKTYAHYEASQIKIGAQLYLLIFYNELGFKAVDNPYLEDGIQHIAMLHTR